MRDTITDADGDGIADSWENYYWGRYRWLMKPGTLTTMASWTCTNIWPIQTRTIASQEHLDADPDVDLLTNVQEQEAGTHPGLADTDDDGAKDGAELIAGTTPA